MERVNQAWKEHGVNRKRILLANDPDILQAVENSFFGRDGFSLLVADSARAAFTMIEERDPALAILALDMTGNGDACCRQVKDDPILRSTPIILVVGDGGGLEADRCAEAGCDDIIARPIDIRRLLACACRLLGITERGAPRADIRLSLHCGPDSGKLHPAQALNLNSGGMFVATERLVPIDTVLKMVFSLPGREFPLRCLARVAWVNHPEWVKNARLPSGMGVEFLDLSAEAAAELQHHAEAQEGVC